MKLTVSMNSGSLLGAFLHEHENVMKSMEKAHAKISSQAVYKLKRGLDKFGGAYDNRGSNEFKTSPKGSLPYKHDGRLQESIGNKVMAVGNKVISSVGSGENAPDVEYAKYLEGRNGNGIRPFLYYIKDIYNEDTITKKFLEYYKPLDWSGK